MSAFEWLRGLEVGWRNVLELLIVAFVLHRLYRLIRRTRAVPMLTGVLVLLAVYAVAWLLQLTLITYLLGLVFTYGAFALVVVFQPELRAALTRLGQSQVTRLFRRAEAGEVVDEIVEAVDRLASRGIGAIIAIERDIPLSEYADSGSPMQATVTADLLTTIFTPYSPLHDGAALVRGDALIAAGCILPLSGADTVDRSLGTRHRAALGLAEETDAYVIVVSEERGSIALAYDGRLVLDLTPLQLRDVLAGRPPRTRTVTVERAAEAS